ncbi:hypothetical protein T492DRAFT_854160 [Pavlovales sp. CCMP2436]|nr:hypothetical protein T492DRAFT_854160 [Pavlovales sp. CCMP2436]
MIALGALAVYVTYRALRPAVVADTSDNTFQDATFDNALRQTQGIETTLNPSLTPDQRAELLRQYEGFARAQWEEHAADSQLAASRLMSSAAQTRSPYAA